MRCLELLNKDDLGSPVALIARMVQSSKVLGGDLVKEGFLRTGLMVKLLDPSCPKDILRDVLMTISNLARLSKVVNFSLVCTFPFGILSRDPVGLLSGCLFW